MCSCLVCYVPFFLFFMCSCVSQCGMFLMIMYLSGHTFASPWPKWFVVALADSFISCRIFSDSHVEHQNSTTNMAIGFLAYVFGESVQDTVVRLLVPMQVWFSFLQRLTKGLLDIAFLHLYLFLHDYESCVQCFHVMVAISVPSGNKEFRLARWKQSRGAIVSTGLFVMTPSSRTGKTEFTCWILAIIWKVNLATGIKRFSENGECRFILNRRIEVRVETCGVQRSHGFHRSGYVLFFSFLPQSTNVRNWNNIAAAARLLFLLYFKSAREWQ